MSRYDSRTTTFSPEGRMYQVEYALEAINNASLTIGILSKEGVVLVADKPVSSTLLGDSYSLEKLYKIDDHIFCAIAGLTADADTLINLCRLYAQRHVYTFGEPQYLEEHVSQICDHKQSYTQYGGLRPFGVSFLFAGWDKRCGFQLFHTDPSGNFAGWNAMAVGMNGQSAQSMLKEKWNEKLTLNEALELSLHVLVKAIDLSKPKADKIELGTITYNSTINKTEIKFMSTEEISVILENSLKKYQDNSSDVHN
ncbi:20S proteasome subunit alpha 3 [Babesia microti strain RI]|uniref:Proteasome subunit alpha type n=1 Tax=Babesia microti (strain RI) TaxID=1133968 RepID=A0A1N6LXS4_BABMR|nr:20S proteasome subunit alpha 3 [Babesia microti strain RI]SIO73675.1 20S proteasome subunit alpha 3 [Babesia microti strain RI]|eukprot:XP_021337746.1 20S proteasome subunit alpha 3 [Babesia microti strain RI]